VTANHHAVPTQAAQVELCTLPSLSFPSEWSGVKWESLRAVFGIIGTDKAPTVCMASPYFDSDCFSASGQATTHAVRVTLGT
jgi:hypothetical protein